MEKQNKTRQNLVNIAYKRRSKFENKNKKIKQKYQLKIGKNLIFYMSYVGWYLQIPQPIVLTDTNICECIYNHLKYIYVNMCMYSENTLYIQ